MHEAHGSCCVALLALFEYRVPHWNWKLAVFDVSSQGHDLVGVHFSLIQFLLYPKAERDSDESRQVIPLVPFLLETLPPSLPCPCCHLTRGMRNELSLRLKWLHKAVQCARGLL